MTELNLNEYKILDNQDFPNKIGYDVRIYEEYGSLAAACLFNKAKILCSKGEAGITDQEFSKMIGISLKSFKRAKQFLKNRLSMRIGKGNKTYYSLTNDLPYDPIFYRSFDKNHCLIMNNNYKGGAFLAQCIYWWNKALEKGQLEFSKTDKQIIKDLPFLSSDILTSIKKIPILKGFITIKRKKRGSEWGVSHYAINLNAIEKALKENCGPKGTLSKLLEEQIIVWAKIPIECGPKSRLSVGQNPASTIYNTIYNSILSSAIDQNTSDKPVYEVVSEERKKIKNKEDEQPMSTSKQSTTIEKEETMEEPLKSWEEKKEIYTMIGIWKEIVYREEIFMSSRVKFALEDAFTKKFDSSLDKWKDYCAEIAADPWLMGNNDKGFKVQLIWAIQPERIAERISKSVLKKSLDKKTTPIPIILDKQELIDEIFSADDPIEIKRIRVFLIDSMCKYPNNIGLNSYVSYFRGVTFLISESDGKKKLIINSRYNAYIGTLTFHREVSMACNGFDEVMIHGGEKDLVGNHINMQRNESNPKPCPLWEKLCVERGIESVLDIPPEDGVNSQQYSKTF